MSLLQPQVEAGLIHVDHALVLLKQLGETYREVVALLRSLLERLIILVAHTQELDLVLLVEVLERSQPDVHVVLIAQLGDSLAEEEPTPSLQGLLLKEHLGHFRGDLPLSLATIQDSGVNVLAVTLHHLLQRVVHGRSPHVKRFGNLGERLALLASFPDLLGFVVGDRTILPLGHLAWLEDASAWRGLGFNVLALQLLQSFDGVSFTSRW